MFLNLIADRLVLLGDDPSSPFIQELRRMATPLEGRVSTHGDTILLEMSPDKVISVMGEHGRFSLESLEKGLAALRQL